MIIELFLLIGLLALQPFFAPNPSVSILISIFILALSLPVIRLIFQVAPPFVPTPNKTVQKMIALAQIKPGERVYDLGCGDGRLLIAAAKQGAVAIGYELSVPTYLLALWNTRGYKNIHVHYGDFWRKDLRDADVIVCYLLIKKMKEFEEKIWPKLNPGTRVVSHSFKMPTVPEAGRDGNAVLYVK